MKIQCDVCDRDEASVFCVADEAALCAACDHRVHHANKLAGKHRRFSLHHPSPKQSPLCDICQERRAFLFCQQDRAILCRECDSQIHIANEHTRKHTRFLLTGVKLSSTAALYSSSESQTSNTMNNVSSDVISNSKLKPVLVSQKDRAPSTSKGTTVQSSGAAAPGSCENLMNNSNSTSSISEYLMEMLPGWHVEDFLDSSYQSPYGFCKDGGTDVMPFWDADLESNMNVFPTEKMGFWVPQVAPPLNHRQDQSMDLAFAAPNGTKEQSKEFTTNINSIKGSRNWSEEDSSFVVPQITSSLSASKRLRTSW